MTPAALTGAAAKDISKMSKNELQRLYKAITTENEELVKKIGKVQKKYKRAKRALDTNQGSDDTAGQRVIHYPIGKTHGRGDFNLADYLLEESNIGKEDYNTFVASIHEAMKAAGIPKTATWRAVRVGPLAEVLDVIRERFPWLAEYDADWPATSLMKQYLKNSRNSASRRARGAIARTAAANRIA